MPTQKLINRFRAVVQAAVAAGGAGSTANVILDSTAGLPTGGNARLIVSTPVLGRRPIYRDTLYGWSATGANTLASAVRQHGAALAVGDIVESVLDAEAWDSLDGDFAPIDSPAFTGDVDFTGADSVDFTGTTVVGLNGGFDRICTSYADILAIQPGERVWVKGGTYTATASWTIPSNVDIVFGAGSANPAVIDLGDTAYLIRGHAEYRKATLAGTSGATATISGNVTDEKVVNVGLPNEAGWKAVIGGALYDYTYASSTTFTLSPTPLVDTPTGGSYANSFVATLTKGAAENVTMRGNMRIKGTSGSGAGTLQPCMLIAGHNWDLSALTLDLRIRGCNTGDFFGHFWSALTGSRIGRVAMGADAIFTRTNAGTHNFSTLFQIEGQNSVYAALSAKNIHIRDENAANMTLTFLFVGSANFITVQSCHAQNLRLDGTPAAGTHGIRGIVNGTPILQAKLASGSMSAFVNGSTLQTMSSNSSSLTGQWTTTNGSASNVTYYP